MILWKVWGYNGAIMIIFYDYAGKNSLWWRFGHAVSSVCVCACVLSRVWLYATPQTVVCQAPLSMGFSRKNTGVGCHFLLRGSSRLRDGTQVSCIAGRFFTPEPPGKPFVSPRSSQLASFHHLGLLAAPQTLRAHSCLRAFASVHMPGMSFLIFIHRPWSIHSLFPAQLWLLQRGFSRLCFLK